METIDFVQLLICLLGITACVIIAVHLVMYYIQHKRIEMVHNYFCKNISPDTAHCIILIERNIYEVIYEDKYITVFCDGRKVYEAKENDE